MMDVVRRLATTNTDAAVAAARQTQDPWRACQGLAWAARFAPTKHVAALARQALAVGRRHPDPFKQTASAAWPIRALVERQQTDLLTPVIREVLKHTPRIEPPASRSEALFLVYQAAFPAGGHWRHGLLDALLAASDPSVHWRQGRNARDAVLMEAAENAGFAAAVARRLVDPRTRRQAERWLGQGEIMTPREFFWM